MSAALVVGHGMDFVNDHGLYIAQDGPAPLGRQQDIERLGRSDQDMWRPLEHLLALMGQGVAGADRSTDLRHEQAFFSGQRGYLGERRFQVFLDEIGRASCRESVYCWVVG